MQVKYFIMAWSLGLLTVFSLAITYGQQSETDPYAWIQQVNAHPFVELTYGPDWPHHKLLGANLPSLGAIELRGGYRNTDTLQGAILSPAEGMVFGSWYSDKLGGGSDGTAGLAGTFARFGFGTGRGYGYDLGGAAIIPYFRSNGSWTRVTTERPAGLSDADRAILDRYEGTFHFGMSAESGVRADFGQTFSASAGYEVNVIYPRFVFWEWLGSSAIAGGANGVVSFVGRKILEASPEAGPIVMFVLKSAVAWGIYQLWRTEMNWPFASETPLTHETLRFSIGYSL